MSFRFSMALIAISLAFSMSSFAQTSSERRKIIVNMKLELKALMLQKLDERTRGHYVMIPDNGERDQALAAMRDFIETKLDDFINRCADVLPFMTERDADSIGTLSQTKVASEFLELFGYLEKHGFYGVRIFNKPINFWSGRVAMRAALNASNELSDSQVPAICVMFDVCQVIRNSQGRYDDYITLLTSSVSRVFASSTLHNPNIYVSSEKEAEMTGFTTPNNFWLAELPALMALYSRGVIQDITINLYDHVLGIWRVGVSLFSREGQMIPVYRRSKHELDEDAHSDRFKTQAMSETDVEKWKASAPRPSIAFGKLGSIAKRLVFVLQMRGFRNENRVAEGEALRAGLRRDLRSASPGLDEHEIEERVDEILQPDATARGAIVATQGLGSF